eukprot:3288525-Prymnesium_polylepis.1
MCVSVLLDGGAWSGCNTSGAGLGGACGQLQLRLRPRAALPNPVASGCAVHHCTCTAGSGGAAARSGTAISTLTALFTAP